MGERGWQTTIGHGGKAHFYATSGVACGDHKGIWPGHVRADLFTRPTRPTVDGDHLCRDCIAKYPRVCLCDACMLKRHAKALAAARKEALRG